MGILSSLFGTNENQQQNQQQISNYHSDYPEVFFTDDYKRTHSQNIQSTISNMQQPQQNSISSKHEMISQILPMLFGKNNNPTNILASLMQSKNTNNTNNSLNELIKNINIFGNNANKTENKKDMPNIIDMSDYQEIKKDN